MIKVVKRLDREDLVDLVNTILYPIEGKLSSSEIDGNLLSFCLNCPDPAGAMDLVLDAPRGAAAAAVVEKALALPARSVLTLSEDELSLDHPLRHWKIEG